MTANPGTIADATALDLVRDIRTKAKRRSTLLIVVILMSAVAEGISASLLFPLLRSLDIGASAGANTASSLLDRIPSAFGLRSTPGVLGTVVVSLAIARGLIMLVEGWLAADLQHRYVATWRQSLFDAAMRARWRFFVELRGGDLANALIGETIRLSNAFYLAVQLLVTFSLAGIYVAIALLASWQTSLCLLAVGGLIALLNRRIVRRSRAVGTQLSREGGEIQAITNEMIAGAKLVKATATEGHASERYSRVVDRLRLLDRWNSFQPHFLRAVFETVSIVALVGILVIGTGTLDVDVTTMLIVVGLFLRLYPRLSSIQLHLQQFHFYLPALATCKAYLMRARLDAEVDADESLPRGLQDVPVSVQVQSLTVRYDETEVLRGASLTVPAGTTIGIVGSSGAGKSTLVDAILRLIEPSAGTIRASGFDVASLPLASWRKTIGYVAQDTFLFHASIRENLAWGVPRRSDADIVEAARRAHVHHFVSDLEHGYGTVVGDRGVRISGGERQRLGLARALVARPKLLILDEATSALDSESEQAILAALRELYGTMTVIMVSHRLSTVRGADAIFVLERGTVVERGTWDDLIDREGRLAELWTMQSRAAP